MYRASDAVASAVLTRESAETVSAIFALTPAESKRLIARGVVALPSEEGIGRGMGHHLPRHHQRLRGGGDPGHRGAQSQVRRRHRLRWLAHHRSAGGSGWLPT